MLFSLPIELISHILAFALEDDIHPCSYLLVNSIFRDVGQCILHSGLHFRTTTQLKSFTETKGPLSCRPLQITINLAGGTADFRLFHLLQLVFLRCIETQVARFDDENSKYYDGRLTLKLLRFCLNSHTSDPNLHLIRDALSLANPEEFIWTGPDPDHHFSIAIVPSATPYLFDAISSWSNLRHLTLTNLAFPSGVTNLLRTSRSLSQCILGTVPLSNLQTIYLGQITFMDPSQIAAIVCSTALPVLQEVKVVDAYRGSIWGPRVRTADIEVAASKAANEFDEHGVRDHSEGTNIPQSQDWLRRIRAIVRCEAKTERIMGGDRVVSGML